MWGIEKKIEKKEKKNMREIKKNYSSFLTYFRILVNKGFAPFYN